MSKIEREIYLLSDTDRKKLNNKDYFQIEIIGNNYLAMNCKGVVIDFLTHDKIVIPLGNERFRRKHYSVTD